MDYEKKYKEALETARKINSGEGVPAPSGWTKLEVVFPELRESEDERIRHALIEFLREAYSRGNAPEECAKWIVWLDQPKEQMMKEAVEGEIHGDIRSQEEEPFQIWAESDFLPLDGEFKLYDKVKLIIVKED